jgi:methylphosphotriester-DNA--protein-cysteine methyltransferase
MFNTQSFRPDHLLRNVIDRYLYVKAELETPYTEYSILPKVIQQLSFNLGRDKTIFDLDNQEYIPSNILIGQNNRICRIRVYNGTNRLIVNLKPLGWYKLFKVPAHRFINRTSNLMTLLGDEIYALIQQLRECKDAKKQMKLLDAFFLELLQQQGNYKNLEEAVRLIHEAKGNITVNQLEKEVFITRRTLERYFLEQAGLYPKMYARIVRFNETIKYMEKNQKPNLAYFTNGLGYCDQSHFINEFQHFAGCVPTRYFDQPLRFESALKS